MESNSDQNINERKLDAMKYRILQAERENIKTSSKTSEQMVDTIRKIIIEEAKKIY